jgi:hypothetical protein
MYFLTPSNPIYKNYISDKILFCNKNDYQSVIAKKNISIGEILIKEYPTINLFGEYEIDKGLQIIKKYIINKENELYPRNYNYKKTKMIKNIHKIINNNSKIKRFFENISKEEIEYYYAKYIYNCFEGGKYGPLTLPFTAKLNHSCTPNVEFKFDEKTGQMITIAIRKINEGEEIYDSYLTKKSINFHIDYLEQHYGFRCDCKL